MKKKYTVEVYEFFDCEEYCRKNLLTTQDTYAVSERQAINNIKFRITGKTSQYRPMAVGGSWENGLLYKVKN